jgi:hypothetical protein
MINQPTESHHFSSSVCSLSIFLLYAQLLLHVVLCQSSKLSSQFSLHEYPLESFCKFTESSNLLNRFTPFIVLLKLSNLDFVVLDGDQF